MKLTGALGMDGSQAALSGLLDFRAGSWSEELCAMGLRQALELIESRIGAPLPALACAGGGAGDRQWLQIKADVLKRPLATACQEEAALFGAALLGGMAAGLYGTEQEMVSIARRTKPMSLVRPDAGRSEIFDRRYKIFKQCSARLRAVFSQLSRIDNSPLETHD